MIYHLTKGLNLALLLARFHLLNVIKTKTTNLRDGIAETAVASGAGEQHRSDSPLKDPGSPSGLQLLNCDEVPSWYGHNPHIWTSYSPVALSTFQSLRSLLYLHNETVDVYSHLIPAAIALLGNGLLYVYFSASFPAATWADQLVFHIYIKTSVICFGISSAYHTFFCHSARYTDLWGRLDYVAIVFPILGSSISGIYIGFYCEPHLQKLYWSMIGSLGFLTGFVVVHPKLQSQKWRLLRLSTFVATGLSAFAPIIHAASIFPYEQLDQQAGLWYYYLEGLVIVVGVLFYTTHFPESWKPGSFDIWESSHQVFHISVVIGAAIHLHGIILAFQWNYENQRCKTG